jgi:hypothetical protein
MISKRIELLLSAYRRDDYADPVGFVTQLGLVLADYPDDVIEYVTDPRTGIQHRQKFPPVIAEVADACHERLEYLQRSAEAEAWQKRRRIAAQYQLKAPEPQKLPGQMDAKEFNERFPGQRPVGRFERPPVERAAPNPQPIDDN